MNLKTETGRSMVEMLGTLAIIGVLSIGGIAGYSYGMDKYRTNEVINETMLRAIDLISQASQGRSELSLSEWEKEKSTYEFGTPIYTEDDLIKLDVGTKNNPIPQRVCEQIFEGMKNQALYIDINGEEMEVNPVCGDNNIMTFYFEGGGATMDVCDPACADDEYCDNGWCFKGDEPISTYDWRCDLDNECCSDFYGPYPNHGKSCTLPDGASGMCYYGECKKSGCTYTENKCEGKNQYCASPNTSGSEAFPNGSTGTCVAADFKRYEIDGTAYYVSNYFLSWWDATAACKALNKKLLSSDELTTGTLLQTLSDKVSDWHDFYTSDEYVVGSGGIIEALDDYERLCYSGYRGCARVALCK